MGNRPRGRRRLGKLLIGRVELVDHLGNEFGFGGVGGNQGTVPGSIPGGFQVFHGDKEGITVKMEAKVRSIGQEMRAKFIIVGDEVVRATLDFLQPVVVCLQNARDQREHIARLYVVHPACGLGKAQRENLKAQSTRRMSGFWRRRTRILWRGINVSFVIPELVLLDLLFPSK